MGNTTILAVLHGLEARVTEGSKNGVAQENSKFKIQNSKFKEAE